VPRSRRLSCAAVSRLYRYVSASHLNSSARIAIECFLERQLYNLLILSKSVHFEDLKDLISSITFFQLHFGIERVFENKLSRLERSALQISKYLEYRVTSECLVVMSIGESHTQSLGSNHVALRVVLLGMKIAFLEPKNSLKTTLKWETR